MVWGDTGCSGERRGDQQASGAPGKQPEEFQDLTVPLNAGQLQDITFHKGRKISVEERGPAAGRALDGLRKTSDHRAVQIVALTQRGGATQPGTVGEGSIDE
ncbi:hypothetical protein Sm713_10960 [Streptomyces sp. TS71-3]|nr:hypothetical protein Sm713_10960 [Streptomyces sp. TS71-3]